MDRRPVSDGWVGLDVGGTKVLADLVDDHGQVLRSVRLSSRDGVEDAAGLEDVLSRALELVCDGARPRGVGVAAAGFVDAAGERVVFAPHLPWRDDAVRERLSTRWGLDVVLENDATCATWAEVEHGALAGVAQGVLVAVGTGIGGGVVVHGEVVRGAGGMAGEFGHTRVVPQGRPCPCGLRGCWEQYASGRALVARAGRAGERGGGVAEAARAGDREAVAAFEEVGAWLGVGVANLVAVLDPEVVVVGGGVAEAGDLLLTPARRSLAEHLVGAGHRVTPPLVPAVHGEHAGTVGAVALARRAAAAR
ncbi:ROK family protein [Nocardioides sp. Y6]|uniref:ROK family protein n=1 Tax=Nocardioides malaquae TaxID=2773426 RepID=A0ABR9RNX4_9ACTN|nr:ROK family protein [Nocardioides malaquae]MBE7323269.1 ROK family protein [Nocardioides malaquae]